MMAHGEENTTFAPNGTTPAPHHHSDEALLQRDGIALLCIIVTLLVVIVVLIGCLCRRRRRQALGEEGPLLQSRSNQPSSSRAKDSAATGFGPPVIVDVDANEQAVLQSDAREALALLHTFCEPPTSGLVSLPLLLRHGRFSEEHRLPKHSGFTCTLAFEPSTPRGVPRLYVTLLPAAPPPSLVDLWSKMCNRSCPVVLGSGNAAFKDGLDCVWLGKFFKYERVAGQNIVFTSSRATPLSAVNAAAFSHTVIRDMFRDIAHSIHVLRVHGWRYEMADAQQLLKVVGLTNDQQRPALQFMFPSLLVPVEPSHNIAYDMYLLATVLCQWLPLDSTLLQPAASIRERAWLSFTGDASQPREGLFMDWNLSKSSSTLAYVQLMLRGIADEATKKEQYSVFLWARAYARFLVTANFDSPKDGDSTTTTTFVPSWLAPSRTGVGGFESSHTAVLEAGLCWLYSLAFSAGMLRGTADVTSWTNAVRLEADIRQQLQCFRSSQANAVSATNNQRLMLPTGELNLELVLQAAGSREHMVSPLSQLLSAININGNSEYNAPTQFTKISKWTIDRVESAVAQLKFGDMIAIATGVSKDGHKLGHLVSFVETVHLHELEGTHGFEQRVFVVFDSANTGSMVVLRGVVKSQVSAFLWKGLLEAEAPLRQRYSSLLEDQANLNHLVGYTEKDLKFPIDVYRLSSRDGPRAAAPTRSEGGGSVVSVDTYSPDQ